MRSNLKLVEEYKKMDDLKPQWKKDLDRINQDLLVIDEQITNEIDKLSMLSTKREKLLGSRKTLLESATSPSLF